MSKVEKVNVNILCRKLGILQFWGAETEDFLKDFFFNKGRKKLHLLNIFILLNLTERKFSVSMILEIMTTLLIVYHNRSHYKYYISRHINLNLKILTLYFGNGDCNFI